MPNISRAFSGFLCGFLDVSGLEIWLKPGKPGYWYYLYCVDVAHTKPAVWNCKVEQSYI